jgi:hypothetical protein
VLGGGLLLLPLLFCELLLLDVLPTQLLLLEHAFALLKFGLLPLQRDKFLLALGLRGLVLRGKQLALLLESGGLLLLLAELLLKRGFGAPMLFENALLGNALLLDARLRAPALLGKLPFERGSLLLRLLCLAHRFLSGALALGFGTLQLGLLLVELLLPGALLVLGERALLFGERALLTLILALKCRLGRLGLLSGVHRRKEVGTGNGSLLTRSGAGTGNELVAEYIGKGLGNWQIVIAGMTPARFFRRSATISPLGRRRRTHPAFFFVFNSEKFTQTRSVAWLWLRIGIG